MVTALSMNPSIDRTLELASFECGATNRVERTSDLPAGKGINLALSLRALGVPVRCVGLLPGEADGPVVRRLQGRDVPCRFVPTSGQVRVNLKILDRGKSVVTELNERGEAVTQAQLDALMDLILDAAPESSYLVLTGSMPPGCPEDYYRTIIRAASPYCRCALDAQGGPLSLGIEARPYLIKPNRAELEMHVGRVLPSMEAVSEAALSLARGGIPLVAVSLGAQGALLTDGAQVLFANAPPAKVRSTVGAGDAMLAGLIAGLSSDAPLEEVFRIGVAAAAASVVGAGSGQVDVDDYGRFLSQIEIQRV